MDYEQQIISTVKKASPAVVSIIISKDFPKIKKQIQQEFGPLDLFEFFGLPKPEMPELPRMKDGKVKIGGGSGFIISADGMILTNRHVISDKEANYTVVLSNGKEYKSKVLAIDPLNDIAIIKIDAKNLSFLKLGDSTKAELGQTIIAIGYALGEFQNTVSVGVVSGLSRYISAITDMTGHAEHLRGLIQTDAAINPGNSGGPLVNLRGEVVGINTAIVYGAQNIGFAIPINSVQKDLDELKKYGKIRQPFLGIRYMLLNKVVKEKFSLPFDYGALIIREPGGIAVVPGSAADKADLRENDIILECNNKKINAENTIVDIISSSQIGSMLEFKIFRKGKTKKIKVKLEERK